MHRVVLLEHHGKRKRLIRKASALALFLLLSSSALEAQSVQGRLVDEDTGEPVGGASVMLLDHEQEVVAGAFTDDEGTFLLRAPRLGRYTIQADRIGYRFYERRERYGRDGLFSGYFMDREEIRRLNPYRVSDVVGSVPGVWGSARHRGLASNITMRRGCNPTIYVDGVELDHGLDIEEVVPASTLVGVEIYTSIPSPMRFYDSRSLKEGRATRCGSIVLWTGP